MAYPPEALQNAFEAGLVVAVTFDAQGRVAARPPNLVTQYRRLGQ
jgi:hypothetical protein